MEHISRGPLTSDLPGGNTRCRGEERAHVVTACELLASHRSPPLSLQEAAPPVSATLFPPPLWGNSITASPAPFSPPSLDGTISVSSHVDACNSGPFVLAQLGRIFMPHYRKWAVFSPHHKRGGRCFNSSLQSQIDATCTVKKNPSGTMFQIKHGNKRLTSHLTIICRYKRRIKK